MKTDIQIQRDVMDELKWQPFLRSSEIGVAVTNGVVTLSGQVDSYAKKLDAEKAVKKVGGVKALAEDLQVGVSPGYRKTDTEIAEAVLHALRWQSAVEQELIKIKVEDGCVKLEGEVEWAYQRAIAETAIKQLDGVRAIYNLIRVKPVITAYDLEKSISAAFERHATIDASKITAQVIEGKVKLRGIVRSLTEKEDAESIAWKAPGVVSVRNDLVIEEPEFAF
ncbi:BON domain-containing protein [Mucilaginibacter aquariorum]|uniref:BON domain-containing protein n=1 Tax=Mucilaginibacter aquariorum TaxID=2967225 RepID=A0ABT1T3N4_9SPHI|nr:BON domain-containing protein [Mucilaginibacter aquariorum]MCQ6959215.1 BON domain-containing protein [Mucilaginibacter aquariorum]